MYVMLSRVTDFVPDAVCAPGYARRRRSGWNGTAMANIILSRYRRDVMDAVYV